MQQQATRLKHHNLTQMNWLCQTQLRIKKGVQPNDYKSCATYRSILMLPILTTSLKQFRLTSAATWNCLITLPLLKISTANTKLGIIVMAKEPTSVPSILFWTVKNQTN